MLAPYVLPQLLARNLLGLLQNKIIFSVFFEFYSKITLNHSRYFAGSNFRSLSKIPHCCRLYEPFLNFIVAVRFFKPAKDYRLKKFFLFSLSNLF